MSEPITEQKIEITAVMVTGKSPERLPMARVAVQAYLEQSFPAEKRELLVINDSGSLIGFEKGGVREVLVPPQLTLGDLRNMAFTQARGQYLAQWDDDDYSHPDRLSYQFGHVWKAGALILRKEIHCNMLTGEAFVADAKHFRAGGFPGTVMHQVDTPNRYPSISKKEDSEFLIPFITHRRLRVMNADPKLYVRFFHGANTWSEKHVIGQHRRNGQPLTADQRTYLDSVLAKYSEQNALAVAASP